MTYTSLQNYELEPLYEVSGEKWVVSIFLCWENYFFSKIVSRRLYRQITSYAKIFQLSVHLVQIVPSIANSISGTSEIIERKNVKEWLIIV